jgi:lipoprotein-anchoring transpeptidase ErfK/SrfK
LSFGIAERENALATLVGLTSAAPAIPAHTVRRTLLASAAFACIAVSLGLVVPAAAQGYYYTPAPYPGYPGVGPNLDPNVGPRPVVRPKPKHKPAASPEAQDDVKPSPKSGTKSAKSNAKPETAKDVAPKGPLQIVVSIANQHVTLYGNGTRVTQSPVSTGVPGRPTPTGVFSIIQKDRFHHSNLYSNAPMPYMERITWSGVALHEGPLPGYPASHGCIRLTHEFAARLWVIAKLGVRVIVARNDVAPVDFAHPRLFGPRAKPVEPPTASGEPEKHAAVAAPVKLAQAASPDADPKDMPAGDGDLRGTVEVRSFVDTAGTVAAPTTDAPAVADPPKPADVADPAKTVPPPPPPKARTTVEPPKHSGTVAVFISRREKKLFVRQDFLPVFDVPVEIDHSDQPFGTHVFTALGLTDDGTQMRWNVMSMPAEQRVVMAPKIGPKGHFESRPAEVYAPQTPAQVLDRIQIPQEAIDRISEILTPGASLVVSDQGLGPETGQGTDFIVLVH